MSAKKISWPLLIALLPFLILMIGFELGPVFTMLGLSFHSDEGNWSFIQFIEAFSNKYYLLSLKNSILISLFSSSIGMILSVFTSYSITRLSPKTQDRILMLSNMTSNFAGVPLAFAYILMLGNSGLFTLLFHQLGMDIFQSFYLYSWVGLIFVYVYFQIPLGTMLLYPAYNGIQEQWQEASSLLGASSWDFWRKIGIPVIFPGMIGTFSMLFANSMGAYATAYALVGSNYNLLPIQIGSLISGDVIQRLELGSALAVILAIIIIGAMLFNEMMMRRVRRDLQ